MFSNHVSYCLSIGMCTWIFLFLFLFLCISLQPQYTYVGIPNCKDNNNGYMHKTIDFAVKSMCILYILLHASIGFGLFVAFFRRLRDVCWLLRFCARDATLIIIWIWCNNDRCKHLIHVIYTRSIESVECVSLESIGDGIIIMM